MTAWSDTPPLSGHPCSLTYSSRAQHKIAERGKSAQKVAQYQAQIDKAHEQLAAMVAKEAPCLSVTTSPKPSAPT